MSVNGWWSSLRADGTIASGNESGGPDTQGIWTRPPSLPGQPDPPAVRVSTVGERPVWAGQTLVYNRNDGSTVVGASIFGEAFNEYLGSDFGQWVGFASVGNGTLYRFGVVTENTPAKNVAATFLQSIDSACKPQFFGTTLGYLKPFQNIQRQLFIGGTPVAHRIKLTDGRIMEVGPKPITEWAADRTGAGFVYAVATGQYTKNIIDNFGNNCTIRPAQDETPLVCFIGPDGLPHMLSQTQTGTLERMIYAQDGHFIPGILDVPDARVIGSQLRVVGSDKGQPRNLWIDFAAPKVDLRMV